MKRESNKDRLRRYFKEYGTITRNEASNLRLTARLSERVREFEAEGMRFSHEWVYADGQRTTDYRYTLLNKPQKMVAVQGKDGVVLVPEAVAREKGLRVLT